MKKEYIKPAMQAIEIKNVSLLVGSLKNVGGNANLIYKGPGTGTACSRGGDGGDYDGGDWGDDEE